MTVAESMASTGAATVVARADLLSLTEDALVALANRGLVKRAAKELAAGAGASISVASDGAIEAAYPDGVTTRLLAVAALTEAVCTCAAEGACRHRVGLVLAYQATYADASAPVLGEAERFPSEISDEALTRLFGAEVMEAAGERLSAGYEAVVYRGRPRGATPRVELPACTVTFHVPGDPAYATTDARELNHAEAVVLAVWAFRVAYAADVADMAYAAGAAEQADVGAEQPDGIRVKVGGAASETGESTAHQTTGSSALPAVPAVPALATQVVEDLLLDGAAHVGPLSQANFRHAVRELDDASFRWPAAVVVDLADQVEWYTQRNARYEMHRAAELICEFVSRRQAADTVGAATGHRASSGTRESILGTTEPQTTELRRIRLTGLGCRIEGSSRHRTAELYFAHPQDGTVLVLRRTWDVEDEANPPTTDQLRAHKIARFPLYQLAASNLVSEVATRSASRVIDLASSSVAKTSILPVGRSWLDLPKRLLVRDYKAFVERLAARDHRFLRPRVAAEDVFVFAVGAVQAIGYHPAQQCLEAVISDEHGTQALIRAEHNAFSPAALDAVADALAGAVDSTLTSDDDDPAPAETTSGIILSATVTVQSGQAVLRPIAIFVDGEDRLVVPDLEPGDGSASLPTDSTALVRPIDPVHHVHPIDTVRPVHHEHADAISAVLDQAADLLAEHAHRGIALLTAVAHSDTDRLARDLRRTGLVAVAALVTEYARALTTHDRAARIRSWSDAWLAVDACRGTV